MKTLIAAAAAALTFAAPPPVAAESERPLLSAYGCLITGDQVLTARALAAEKVARDAASRILLLMYPHHSDQGGPFDRLREEIIDLAYRSTSHPHEIQTNVIKACHAGKGSLDALFGTRL